MGYSLAYSAVGEGLITNPGLSFFLWPLNRIVQKGDQNYGALKRATQQTRIRITHVGDIKITTTTNQQPGSSSLP